MMKIFASPSRYIQGEKALFENAKAIINLGSHPILLTDNVVYDIVGKRFETYLNQEGLIVDRIAFNGEASINEIDRVFAIAKEKGNDLIIGLGGGKTIDSAKAIADLLEIPVIIALQLPRQMLQHQPCPSFILTKVLLKNTFSIPKIQILF